VLAAIEEGGVRGLGQIKQVGRLEHADKLRENGQLAMEIRRVKDGRVERDRKGILQMLE
jgi:hypothetical protein